MEWMKGSITIRRMGEFGEGTTALNETAPRSLTQIGKKSTVKAPRV